MTSHSDLHWEIIDTFEVNANLDENEATAAETIETEDHTPTLSTNVAPIVTNEIKRKKKKKKSRSHTNVPNPVICLADDDDIFSWDMLSAKEIDDLEQKELQFRRSVLEQQVQKTKEKITSMQCQYDSLLASLLEEKDIPRKEYRRKKYEMRCISSTSADLKFQINSIQEKMEPYDRAKKFNL